MKPKTIIPQRFVQKLKAMKRKDFIKSLADRGLTDEEKHVVMREFNRQLSESFSNVSLANHK